jgi:hypothetical protein
MDCGRIFMIMIKHKGATVQRHSGAKALLDQDYLADR